MKLSFVKSKKLTPQANSDRSLVLRQQYALEMMNLLGAKKRVINIDETWINETSFIRRAWSERNGKGNTQLNSVSPRLSMIAAIDTEGRVWFTLSHANTDSNMIALFLHSLTETLDRETPGWQEDTVFMWDNATYHSSEETRAVIKTLNLSLIFSGPYSYSAAPIELLFAGLKMGELNPDRFPTGKR